MKPKIRYVDIIYPPPPGHVSGTIPRQWITRGELEQMYREEEWELYRSLLGRIDYDVKGLRANKHFQSAYNDTRKFFQDAFGDN